MSKKSTGRLPANEILSSKLPASGSLASELRAGETLASEQHASEILTHWQAGEGLPGVLAIDGHIHIGEWPHNTTFQNVQEAVDNSQRTMDANGVDAICAVGGGYLWAGADYCLGNDFLRAVWRRMPERLIPFFSINPNDRWSTINTELDRMYDIGMRCIKLINFYQDDYPGDGPNLMSLYEYASEHRMLVFNHTWKTDVILNISESFPDVDFIYGHYSGWQNKALAERKNVYANIWALGNYGWLDRGIAAVGARKFMLGSDGFLNCLSVGIGPVVHARISDQDKRLILGENVARLLDKVGALPAVLKAKLS